MCTQVLLWKDLYRAVFIFVSQIQSQMSAEAWEPVTAFATVGLACDT